MRLKKWRKEIKITRQFLRFSVGKYGLTDEKLSHFGVKARLSTEIYTTENWQNYERITHAYVHRLADVHLAGFAPAFTLSLCDSEYARNPPVPIASVVMRHSKKSKKTELRLKNLWRTVRFYDINRRVYLSRICATSSICSADNSSQIFEGRIGF